MEGNYEVFRKVMANELLHEVVADHIARAVYRKVRASKTN